MYNLYAQFPKQQICKDRQYAALLRWAAYQGALPIPGEKPDEQFVANKVLAQRIPPQVDSYVQTTISLTIADPGVQTNIRQHLSAFNDEQTEASMDLQVDAALSAMLPLFAKTQVMDSEIQKWYDDNGFEETMSPPLGRLR
jgi:hypothetical protein